MLGTEAYKEYELYLHRQHINEQLAKAKQKAKKPTTKWLEEDDFWEGFEAAI